MNLHKTSALLACLTLLALAPHASAQGSVPAAKSEQRVAPGASVVLLSNGTQLSVQGAQAWLTDLSSGQRLELKRGPLTARTQAALVVVPDGSVWLLGGVDSQGVPLRSVERFNPQTQSFEAINSPSLNLIARSQHSVTLLLDGRIFIAGGQGANGQALSDIELIDPQSRSVETFSARLSTPRTGHSASYIATAAPTDAILIQGGTGRDGKPVSDKDSEAFERSTGRLVSATQLPTAAVSILPTVQTSLPADGAQDVSVQARIGLRFSQPMRMDSIHGSTVVLMGPSGRVPAQISAAEGGWLAFITPAQQLLPGASYSVLVSQVQTPQGQPLALWSASFRTQTLGATERSPKGVVAPKVIPVAPSAVPTPAAPTSADDDDDEHWTPSGNNYKGDWTSGREGRALNNPPRREQVRRAVHPLPSPSRGGTEGGDGVLRRDSSPDVSAERSPTDPIPTLTLPLKGRESSIDLPLKGRELNTDLPLTRSPSSDSLPFKGRAGEGMGSGSESASTLTTATLPTTPGDADGLPSAPAGVTALAGQVLRINGKPLAHVTLRVGSISTQTDENGEFLLTQIPSGSQVLAIEGASANHGHKTYGRYDYRLNITANQTNALPFIIWMPLLDTKHAVKISAPTTKETIITNPKLPGLELRIPAGTVIRDVNGKIVTEVSITPVSVDQTPFPMQYLGVPIYFTIQPGGATIQSADGKPKYATLHYPNYALLPPGAITELFDYDPQGRGWYVYGHATVSADTMTLQSQQELRIYQFTATSAASSGGTPGENDPPPCDASQCCTGDQDPDTPPPSGGWEQEADQGSPQCNKTMDPVDAATSHMGHAERDLCLPDLIPIDIRRVYRSGDVVNEAPSVRTFGASMTHSYEMYLYISSTEVAVVFPNGSRIKMPHSSAFFHTPSGPHTATSGRFYGAYISRSGYDLIFNLRDGTKWGFSYYGAKLMWLQNRNGNRLTIDRLASGTGPVSRVTGPSGRYVDFKYNTSNLIESITDHLGRTFTYTYLTANGHQLLSQVTDPLGGKRTYSWDTRLHGVQPNCKPVDRLTQITDPNGNVMVANSFAWAPQCEPSTTSAIVIGHSGGGGGGAGGGSSNVMRPVNGPVDPNPPAVITEPCYIAAQTLADGSTFSCTRTLNLVTGTTYRVASAQITDRRGNVRKAEFDTNGRVVKNTFPVGKAEEQVHQYERDASGRLTAQLDPLNRRTEYLYDTAGNLTQIAQHLSTNSVARTSFTYNSLGQPTKVTNPLGYSTRYSYDLKGNLTAVANPLGQIWRLTRNAKGQVIQLTDPLGQKTVFTYDGPDLASVTDPLGRKATQFNDAVGRPLAQTSPTGAKTQTRYDALNRRTQMTTAQGHVISFAFDANGNLKTHADEKGNTTQYAYNTLGKVMTKTDPLLQVESYLYEPGGKLSRKTDRKGQVAGITYDAHGRPTQIGFGATAGAPTTYKSTVTLTWDKGNRLTKIVDSVSGTITRSYTALDQVLQESSPQGTVRYSYDKAGQRLSQTVTGQPKVSYTYNAAGQVTQISQDPGSSNNNQAQVVSFLYDAIGRRTQTTLANGSTVNYVYDAASQLTGMTHQKSDGSVMGTLTYTYDLNGKRTSASGSLASIELPSPVTGTAFDANNRLTQHNGSTYTYDKNGNLTSDGARNYVWDERDRLKSIGGAAVASFVYDSMGRRITKTVAGTTTGFLFDGPNFVQELAGSGSASPVKANLLTGGIDETFLRSATGSAATLSHFLPDANNNVIALTDSTQNIVTSYKYTPYGETTQTGAANGNTQQYTGRENDGTGLMYYRARYYHLGCNRFISEDPIGWASGQTNNYGYVGGDPVSFRDPEGEIAFIPIIIWGARIAMAGYGAYKSYQGGYDAYMQTMDNYCRAGDRIQKVVQDPDSYIPETQKAARAYDDAMNLMDGLSEPALRIVVGGALMSVGLKSPKGVGIAVLGTAVGMGVASQERGTSCE